MIHSHLTVFYSLKILSAPLCSSQDVHEFLTRLWDESLLNLQEQVYVLCLNGSNEVICWRCFNTGHGSETLFDTRLILSCALGCMATKLILSHNHPSGILKPSFGDIDITKKFNQASALMDIKLEDHIIISRLGYYSFRDHLLLTG